MNRQSVGVFLALSLFANVLCVPVSVLRIRRQSDSSGSASATSTVKSSDSSLSNDVNYDLPPSIPRSNDDDENFDLTYPDNNAPSGGGSNIFSLLNLATSFLPASSGSSSQLITKFLKKIVKRYTPKIIFRRQDFDNQNEIDYIADLKPPPLQRQEESKESENGSSNESNDNSASEESLEIDEGRNESKQESDSNADTDEEFDDDYDEPPGGGDGEGGGLLGLLAGLSGGEDGQSDLGSLLATVSGIIANLSGDGIDLNALIASGVGLFVGLLSEGEENPGEIIASYLLTSLDTITGGGAKNNGAFFGKFLSKLVRGTSAAGDPDEDSDEDGNKIKTKDSAGFFLSLLTSLLGDMSKGSSGSHPWRRYLKDKRLLYLWK